MPWPCTCTQKAPFQLLKEEAPPIRSAAVREAKEPSASPKCLKSPQPRDFSDLPLKNLQPQVLFTNFLLTPGPIREYCMRLDSVPSSEVANVSDILGGSHADTITERRREETLCHERRTGCESPGHCSPHRRASLRALAYPCGFLITAAPSEAIRFSPARDRSLSTQAFPDWLLYIRVIPENLWPRTRMSRGPGQEGAESASSWSA